MKDFIKKHIISISLSLLGILGGFLYWRFIGCKSGSCPITSTWYMSSLMGGIIGYLIGDSIKDFKKKQEQKKLA